MITYTEVDTNVAEIVTETKLFNLNTIRKYHIYGLRQLDNPLILIEYSANHCSAEFVSRLNSLIEFFKLNGIDASTFDGGESDKVDIGLRLDLRKHFNANKKPLLAASIVSTIVYCLEDRVDIEQMKKHKLSCIPTFVNQSSDTSKPLSITGAGKTKSATLDL